MNQIYKSNQNFINIRHMLRNTMDLKKIFLTDKDILTDILGQKRVKNQVKSALIADRHIVILGPPGVGKTTLARNVAGILPKKDNKTVFMRIQGSPDLTAEDLLGDIDPIKALKHGPTSVEAFTPGKIFKADGGVLFFDELNRCPEKLQNALLQVLQERIVTIGTYDLDFTANFVFIATMNPEDSSTEKLSDVLLDRMDMIYMTYPESLDIEKQIVKEKGKDLGAEFPDDLLTYCVSFVRELRENDKLEKVPSVRASLGLYERGQSIALLNGKEKVNLEDVKQIMESVLTHRIKLKPSVKYLQKPKEFVKESLKDFNDRFDPSQLETAHEDDGEDP